MSEDVRHLAVLDPRLNKVSVELIRRCARVAIHWKKGLSVERISL